MSPVPQDRRRSYLARQVGTLALARVTSPNPMGLVRAASWHNHLHRLGLPLPFVVVHDLGLLLTTGGQQGVAVGPPQSAPPLPPQAAPLLGAYEELLRTLQASEVVQTATAWQIRDELVAVLLMRLLRDLVLRWPERRTWIGAEELPLDPGVYLNADIAGHFRDFDPNPVISLLHHLVSFRLHLMTSVEQIDLDTLRLLGLFRVGDQIGGVVDLADLLNVFSSPEANDVVNFSMELIPSILETKKQSGVQVFSIDGYASIERHGSVDSIVLSEFAFDNDIFEQKLVDNELYYYGHEKQRMEERRLQYILVDSSASMRGQRQVFARGLALTLMKKLALQGDEVWLRFFDSRLYELVHVEEKGEAAVPYLLCFRSERGRNYGRVFRQLLSELERLRRQDGRPLVLYIITHGQCHVTTDLIERLRQVAHLYGVFILPSSTLHLDYLPLLHRQQIVSAEALSSRKSSVDRALEIVDDAAATREGQAAPAAPAEER
jgi:hypothetical protein